MVIPIIMGIARGAGMAARGIGAAVKGVGRGIGAAAKGGGRGIKKGSQWGIEGVSGHPAFQRVANHPVVQRIVNHPVTQKIAKHPATKVIGGAAGLMGGLALGGLRGLKRAPGAAAVGQGVKQGGWILIFPFLLAILDFILGKNGIPLDFLWNNPGLFAETVTRIVVHSPYWVLLVIYLILRKPHSKEEFLFPAILLLVGFLTITFGGWNNWIFFHMIFAGLTFFLLLGGFNPNRPIGQAHWIFLIIFVIDIFGLATLKGLNAGIMGGIIPAIFLNRIIFPIWFFYYLALIKESSFKTGMSIFIVLFYAGYIGFNYVGVQNIEIQDLDIEKAQAGGAIKQAIENWRDAGSLWFSNQIQYAITGKVEENQYEPLGVYLENVQSADPKYYADEDVIIWGTVKARTLDEVIKIKVGCYVDEYAKIPENHADKVDPGGEIEVFTSEELDFACSFTQPHDGNPLKVGTNAIRTFANFNFETLAYLKTYFIDNERRRAMVREGLDVFEEFDIKDKNPFPVYTNGPVAIEMGTSSSLVSVSEEGSIASPRFSVDIENRGGWEGEITSLNELVLLLPNGVEIIDTKEDCNRDFENYNKEDCEASCSGDNKEDCEKECELLLGGSSPAYNGYRLAETEINKFDERMLKDEDVERFRRFNCKITPDVRVLGNTPITTKYFRVKVKYDYRVEKPITVKIVEVSEDDEHADGLEVPESSGESSTQQGSLEIDSITYTEDKNGVSVIWGIPYDVFYESYDVYRKEKGEGEYGNPIDGRIEGTISYQEVEGAIKRYIVIDRDPLNVGTTYIYKVRVSYADDTKESVEQEFLR